MALELASKTKLRQLITASTATAALGDPAATTTKPSAGLVDVGDWPLLQALLGGAGADNSVVNFQGYGIIRYDLAGTEQLVPILLARGWYTLGTELQADGVRRWADTITLTLAAAGVEARDRADHIADLVLPAGPFHYIVFETDVDDATSADVFTHLCQAAGGEEADEVALTAAGGLTALAAIQAVLDDMDAEIVAASGIELLCVAAATSYNTGAVLTAGVTYEVTAENGTIYLGVADTTTDANKEMTVPAGATRRFTMPATKTTLYYSTEDGAGIVGRLSRVA